MFAERFVHGFLFRDVLDNLPLPVFPYLKVAHHYTTQRRPRTGVRQDVVYVAPSLNEVHSTPLNDLDTLKEL